MAEVIVEFRGVGYRVEGQEILRNITFSVKRGEYLALLGPNGAGKTTLLRILLGLIRPTQGEVRVFGKPPWHLSRAERSRIGYVPQLAEIDLDFPIRVYDVVMMGRYGRLGYLRRPGPEDHRAVKRALALMGIQDLARRRLRALSGGQRQRVFIARALASEPELLVLDEPTTSLDTAMAEGLYELLDQLQQELNLTIILVSHDVGVVAERVDTVACLAGELVTHGRPQEVLDQATLECMYGREALVFGHSPVPHMLVPPHSHEKKQHRPKTEESPDA